MRINILLKIQTHSDRNDTCKCSFIITSYDQASYEVESFKDGNDLAPAEIDNSEFLLPGVHGRGREG